MENANNSVDEMLQKASQTLGTSSQNLKQAIENKNVNNLLKNLETKDAQKLSNILSDKEATKKLLSTPKAKQLLKKFFGGK